ncbi:MAG: hypothetical protein K9J30_12680 [Bacteroidales bacterium]|nr:hypothetical protein [Bacteroidales bacterium]
MRHLKVSIHLTLLFLTFFFLFSCMKKEDHHIDISYSEDQLRYINVPLGGIGTGNLLLNGYGSIREIEIFNRASVDELPPYMTFFTLYTRKKDYEPVVRIMEREFLNEYPNPFGKPRQQLGGIPRFRDATFHNAYPVVSLDLADEKVPLEVSMTAWSPFIPTDPVNSSLPCAMVEWELYNAGKEKVDFSIAFTMGDPFASDALSGDVPLQKAIEPFNDKKWKGFTFSSGDPDTLQPDQGSLRVLLPDQGNVSIPLSSGTWWDDAHLFWNDFSDDGKLVTRTDTVTTEGASTKTAAGFIGGSLKPGEKTTIPVMFVWHIPYRRLESNMSFGNDEVKGAVTRNYYTVRFDDIDTVTSYITENLEKLRDKTFLFSKAMTTSSVPGAVLDAAISNSASLKSNLMMQDVNGDVHGYEGLGNDFGCCAGNCTHVWNYAQTMAALFPSLERNVRETGFLHSTHDNGYQCFRTVFPLSDNWFKSVAADGQMGNIMRVYREWKMSGSNEWLGLLWPDVKNALEFAWKGTGDIKPGLEWMKNHPVPWDPYKEGVLRGDQHNTYDINFFGPNMMTGSLYLGALKACSEMAMAMNEPQKSKEYYDLYELGKKRYADLLWNGEYFEQDVEVINGVTIPERLKSPPNAEGSIIPKYQYGSGCLSDQLLGQYLAFISGAGYIMDTAMTQKALESVYTNNFRKEMRNFENVQRIYAANDEPGLVICSWSHGDKPLLPFVYSDEVWTGIEYQVATSLIFTGMVEKGLNITKAVRSRYDGSNRNPFAEIESGRYYARAMSSWGVYQAMSGYSYDGIRESMKFSPAVDVLPMRFFWSTGSGWGTINVARGGIYLDCHHGQLEIEELVLEGRSFFVFREYVPSHDAKTRYTENRLSIFFPKDFLLEEGEVFSMTIP